MEGPMKRLSFVWISLVVSMLVLFPVISFGQEKKVLYIASYHPDKDEWTAGIKAGIDSVLNARSDIVLRAHNMDTRLTKSEEEKTKAALLAKQEIESWQPDVVITSDDNAAKYLIQPYYQDTDLPFVFCGLNWDASVYGLPYTNTTGMIEVQLIKEIIDHLSPYAKGKRIGTLRGDTQTNVKEQKHFEAHLGVSMESRYVNNLTEWKTQFQQLQQEVDMLVLGSIRALDTHEESLDEIAKFAVENTKVPTAAYDEFMQHLALVTLSTLPEEQGQWAARQALRILDGTPPSSIPLEQNRRAKRFLNMKIARSLGIRFPVDLLESSHLVSAMKQKVFFVNSYHLGYPWSDGIEKGLLKALQIKQNEDNSLDTAKSRVDLRIFRMNTKMNSAEKQIQQAAQDAKTMIDTWQPDVIVACDDNAAKYLIQPYYLNSSMPVVFCGINYDAGVYSLPSQNSTGMIEIEHLHETIEILKQYARGDRIGYIGSNDLSNQKSLGYHKSLLGIDYTDGSLVSTFDEWKNEYKRLQSSVDMLIIINPVGIRGWAPAKVDEFLLEHTKIPSGAGGDSEVRYALLGNVKIAEEQGWWSGLAALKILDGTPPSSIALTRNEKSRLYLNMPLAKALGIKFPVHLLEQATMLGTAGSADGHQ